MQNRLYFYPHMKNVFPNELKRPRTPSRLSKVGKKLWRDIVNSLPVDWFKDSDLPLLESYCLLYSQVRECEQALETESLVITDVNGMVRPNPWHKILMDNTVKMATLATKLRLCPNARHSGNVAGNASPKTSMNTTGAGNGNVRRMFGS